jgi:hypothetical protein
MTFDRTLPAALAEANAMTYDYNEGNGVDFEPYSEFMSPEDNTSWIRAWTGNQDLEGSEFRVFGQDGTGGYAAFWIARDTEDLTEQPIVFFGSEGELGIVARHLGDYMWLIAGGFGPCEAVAYPDSDREIDMEKADLAARHFPQHEKSAREVIRLAREEFPDFEESIRSLCK